MLTADKLVDNLLASGRDVEDCLAKINEYLDSSKWNWSSKPDMVDTIIEARDILLQM